MVRGSWVMYDVQVIQVLDNLFRVIDYRDCSITSVHLDRFGSGYRVEPHGFRSSDRHNCWRDCFVEVFGECNVIKNDVVPCLPSQCFGNLNDLFKMQVVKGRVIIECLALSERRERFAQLEGVRIQTTNDVWYGYGYRGKEEAFTFFINTPDGRYFTVKFTEEGVQEQGAVPKGYQTLERILF